MIPSDSSGFTPEPLECRFFALSILATDRSPAWLILRLQGRRFVHQRNLSPVVGIEQLQRRRRSNTRPTVFPLELLDKDPAFLVGQTGKPKFGHRLAGVGRSAHSKKSPPCGIQGGLWTASPITLRTVERLDRNSGKAAREARPQRLDAKLRVPYGNHSRRYRQANGERSVVVAMPPGFIPVGESCG